MSQKTLAVSIVIPAYNEEKYLQACLQSLAKQTVKPDEVIVVDNNSTDRTAQIAGSFSFVTVVHEPVQGVTAARTAGFNAARGDIVGRLDSDSRIPVDWVKNVTQYLADHPETDAVTAGNDFYDIPLSKLIKQIHKLIYFKLQSVILGGGVLWGSNMAMRRSAWQQLANEPVADVAHEDIDLFVKFKQHHLKVRYLPALEGSVSMRRGNSNVFVMAHYLFRAPQTYFRNKLYLRGALFGLVLLFVYVLSLPVLLVAGLSAKG